MCEYPRYLWILLTIVPMILLTVVTYRRWQVYLKALGGRWRFPSLHAVYYVKLFFGTFFFLLAVVLAVLALSHFRWGEELVREERQGHEMVFILDLSRSMLAADITPSRLERAKLVIKSLIMKMDDARFGLVVFKGQASRVVPVTEDTYALFSYLDMASPDLLPSKGSNLQRAIEVALATFPTGSARRRIGLLLSDGESMSGDPLVSARRARDRGIPIYCVTLGTQDGSEIPLGEGSVVKDALGRTVRSKLDHALLASIAAQSGGKILSVAEAYQFEPDDLAAREEAGATYRLRPIQRYRYLLNLSLACLAISLLLRAIRWRQTL